MSLPETCPFCGTGVFTNFCGQNGWKETWVAYECHTWVFADRDRANNQSNLCISRERARLAARVAELEAENKALRDRFSDADTERNAAQGGLKAAFARVAELEVREKQAREDEDWANERTVLVEFHPVTSGWHAFALGVVKRFNAVEPTIHGALRALREKMEAKP